MVAGDGTERADSGGGPREKARMVFPGWGGGGGEAKQANNEVAAFLAVNQGQEGKILLRKSSGGGGGGTKQPNTKANRIMENKASESICLNWP